MIWLGIDILHFIEMGGTLLECPVRFVYVPLGAIDIPVLKVMLGSFLAGVMSRRQRKSAVMPQTPSPAEMGHSTSENPSTTMNRPSDHA